MFLDIDEKEIDKIIKNIEGEKLLFEKNRKITQTSDPKLIGIILKGTLLVEKYDYDGNRIIFEKIYSNSIIGGFIKRNDLAFVTETECEIIFFQYDVFLKKNKNNLLLVNLFDMFSKKILNMNIRLDVLSRRSTKEKILTYFSYLTNFKKNKSFILPWTYTDLADYLAVDRSAMMREIKKLKNEKYIKANGKKITLINF